MDAPYIILREKMEIQFVPLACSRTIYCLSPNFPSRGEFKSSEKLNFRFLAKLYIARLSAIAAAQAGFFCFFFSKKKKRQN
jgi:hypothetical protein